jgi:hypothetical protein
MKIYGLTPSYFFAAIVIGIVISGVLIMLWSPQSSLVNQEVKPVVLTHPVNTYNQSSVSDMIMTAFSLLAILPIMIFIIVLMKMFFRFESEDSY